MYELLEYLIAIGGSVVLFFITKSTNMGVRQFTLYLCVLVVWSIVLYAALYLIHKAKSKSKKPSRRFPNTPQPILCAGMPPVRFAAGGIPA